MDGGNEAGFVLFMDIVNVGRIVEFEHTMLGEPLGAVGSVVRVPL